MSRGGNTVPSITNAEHIGPQDTGDNIEAKRVANYEWDTANGGWKRRGLATTEKYDYSSSTVIYTATAPIGTSTASTGWTITKYDLTDSSDASGKVATDVSWTNRATGTYA